MAKIGIYTWQEEREIYNDNLLKYLRACIDEVLLKRKWRKQEHCKKKIKATIEVQDSEEHK
jgi:hypothetical protein